MVQLNTIEKSDILSRDEYKSKRKSLREKMVLILHNILISYIQKDKL